MALQGVAKAGLFEEGVLAHPCPVPYSSAELWILEGAVRKEPTELEAELLATLAAEQKRYEAGRWNFTHTLRGRTCYLMAKARGRLSPTHIPGRFNIDRHFRGTFKRTIDRLIKRGFVKTRVIAADKQPEGTFGYNRHQAKAKDAFVTEAGRRWLIGRAAADAVVAPDGDLGAPRSKDVVEHKESEGEDWRAPAWAIDSDVIITRRDDEEGGAQRPRRRSATRVSRHHVRARGARVRGRRG